ncbi:hypothetical protein [Halobacterium yunchengense]|uniref:DUF7856 family protein n=1 Tax=Halobacterium yunchengense TaxID=3108497 RepID=UPI00300AC1D2
MNVRFAGVDRSGPAVDLRDADVDAETVVRAVRDPDDDRVRGPDPETGARALFDPAALHERVGFLRRGTSVAVVPAVAAAARSRGASTEYDAALREVRRELDDVDAPAVDVAAARERVAETAADVDRLREAVSRASGRVEALRDAGGDVDAAEADLAAATRELAERETEYHAAREALAAAERRAREARDARERRLELEDRFDNRRRDARRALADAFSGSFRRAVAALPVPGEPARPAEFAGPDWAAACAVARTARTTAPVVVAADLVESATGGRRVGDASRWRAALDAPVVLVEV